MVVNVVAPLGGLLGRQPAHPEVERHLVELARALPRHRGTFLEGSALTPAAAHHFLRQVLPKAPAEVRGAAVDRLARALAENEHNLVHAEAVWGFVRDHASERMDVLAVAVRQVGAPLALAEACRNLRRLGALALPPQQRMRARALVAEGQAALAQAGASLPIHADTLRASQLSQLLQLSPLSKVRFGGKAAGAGVQRFSFVSAPAVVAPQAGSQGADAAGAAALRGVMGPSEERRGRLSKIKPLLLEDDSEWIDRVAKLEDDRGPPDARMSVEIYRRQTEAGNIVASKLRPRGSFYDAKGDLHDVVPRYDGDLIHLMQVHGNYLPHLGLVLAAAEEVLVRLEKLAAAGWGHFDIKPDNVLWRRDAAFALTDYDTAQPLASLPHDFILGSRGYVAPEMLIGKARPTAAADLFSLGVTLGKMLAPIELDAVPLVDNHSLVTFRDPDEDLAAFLAEQVEADVADYVAYQQARLRAPAQLEQAPYALPYEQLRAAIERVGDPWLASLVVDRLLHADPAARGTAGEALQALRQRYPAGHPVYADNASLLRQSSLACPYTVRMDASYRNMRSYRDGLVRAGAAAPRPPPPEPPPKS